MPLVRNEVQGSVWLGRPWKPHWFSSFALVPEFLPAVCGHLELRSEAVPDEERQRGIQEQAETTCEVLDCSLKYRKYVTNRCRKAIRHASNFVTGCLAFFGPQLDQVMINVMTA